MSKNTDMKIFMLPASVNSKSLADIRGSVFNAIENGKNIGFQFDQVFEVSPSSGIGFFFKVLEEVKIRHNKIFFIQDEKNIRLKSENAIIKEIDRIVDEQSKNISANRENNNLIELAGEVNSAAIASIRKKCDNLFNNKIQPTFKLDAVSGVSDTSGMGFFLGLLEQYQKIDTPIKFIRFGNEEVIKTEEELIGFINKINGVKAEESAEKENEIIETQREGNLEVELEVMELDEEEGEIIEEEELTELEQHDLIKPEIIDSPAANVEIIDEDRKTSDEEIEPETSSDKKYIFSEEEEAEAEKNSLIIEEDLSLLTKNELAEEISPDANKEEGEIIEIDGPQLNEELEQNEQEPEIIVEDIGEIVDEPEPPVQEEAVIKEELSVEASKKNGGEEEEEIIRPRIFSPIEEDEGEIEEEHIESPPSDEITQYEDELREEFHHELGAHLEEHHEPEFDLVLSDEDFELTFSSDIVIEEDFHSEEEVLEETSYNEILDEPILDGFDTETEEKIEVKSVDEIADELKQSTQEDNIPELEEEDLLLAEELKNNIEEEEVLTEVKEEPLLETEVQKEPSSETEEQREPLSEMEVRSLLEVDEEELLGEIEEEPSYEIEEEFTLEEEMPSLEIEEEVLFEEEEQPIVEMEEDFIPETGVEPFVIEEEFDVEPEIQLAEMEMESVVSVDTEDVIEETTPIVEETTVEEIVKEEEIVEPVVSEEVIEDKSVISTPAQQEYSMPESLTNFMDAPPLKISFLDGIQFEEEAVFDFLTMIRYIHEKKPIGLMKNSDYNEIMITKKLKQYFKSSLEMKYYLETSDNDDYDMIAKRKSTGIEEVKIKFNSISDEQSISSMLNNSYNFISDFDTFMLHVIQVKSNSKNQLKQFIEKHRNIKFMHKRVGNYSFLISLHKYYDRGYFRVYHFFVNPIL